MTVCCCVVIAIVVITIIVITFSSLVYININNADSPRRSPSNDKVLGLGPGESYQGTRVS